MKADLKRPAREATIRETVQFMRTNKPGKDSGDYWAELYVKDAGYLLRKLDEERRKVRNWRECAEQMGRQLKGEKA